MTSTTIPPPPAPGTRPHGVEGILAKWRRTQDDLDRVQRLFVVGCGKSGTTWLRNVLNGHPRIVVQGEGCFAWRLVPLLAQAVAAFNEHQSRGQPEITKLRDQDFLLTARLIIDNQFARYLDEARAAGRDLSRVTIVGDKTPQHTIGIELLNSLYPKAKFVHIMRDPRDVATSAWFHDGVNDRRNFEQYIRHFMNEVWPLQVGTARRTGPRLGPARYCELRYEDLLTDEERQLRRVVEFLGVEATTEALRACRAAGDFRKLSGGRARGEEDSSNFYRKGVAGDWRNHLPAELAADCCAKIAPLMRDCGYDPECRAEAAAVGLRQLQPCKSCES